ncbi:MAG: FAD-binding protein, partial [Armatimonadia bacterium]|nr:FAD-binding protein [Armatimonadia bacterium]
GGGGGAVFVDASGEVVSIRAGATVLATGGAGWVFEHNAYPGGMFGTGYAAALRAGARLANMEFIQIGPCISHPVKFALSGIFWRMDPKLTNGQGQEFLEDAVPSSVDLESAIHIKGHSFPFTVRNDSVYIDVAIYREIAEGRGGPHGGVFIDVSHNSDEELERRARVPLEHLLERGLDFRQEPMEFAPSIQHCNGGVLIDRAAATDLRGLFAAGEGAGGQHGADRPGGNALADSQVFGRIAGQSAAAYALGAGIKELDGAPHPPEESQGGEPVADILARVQRAMWRGCSVVRTEEGLAEAQGAVDAAVASPPSGSLTERLDLRDALAVARTHLACARRRKESRGTHLRADHPVTKDPEWVRIQTLRLTDGDLEIEDIVPEFDDNILKLWQESPENRSEPLAGF